MDEIQNLSINNVISKGFVSTEDQISFKDFLSFLYRNRKTIFLFALVGSILGVVIALSSKRTYEGQFQIVLENENKPLNSLSIGVASQLNTLSGLAGISTSNKELKTQVAILKSPSVLMSVFEYVKAEKTLLDKRFKDMRFKGWRKKSFDFKLEKGTEVLNLAYRDKDKRLILPVLEKISNIYQNYTGEKNSQEFQRSIDYHEEQIAFFKSKIPNLEEEVINYGRNNNLSVIKTNITSNIKSIEGEAITLLNVEDIQNSINLLDKKLIDLSSIYAENDRNIQDLLRRKKALIESSKRPPGVVAKYKQLLNELDMDRKTLVSLESNLRIVNLQKARNSDPWRLITKPTLLPKPVAPKRRNIALIWTIIGFLAGSLISIVFEKRKGTIFSNNDIKSQINLPVISKLNCDSKNLWLESLYLIISNIITENNEKIGILFTNELDSVIADKIELRLGKFIDDNQLVFTNKINEIYKLDKSILLFSLGTTKKSTLMQIKNGILFKEDSFLGLITLNNFNI